MYGLVNRSVQCFVEDTYGCAVWDAVVREVRMEFRDFEAMLSYDDALTGQVIEAAAINLKRDRESLLEDLGAYLVTHKNMETVRRLMRFGGHTFEDFLLSLDDLHDRVKLAVPDLELPQMSLKQVSGEQYKIICEFTEAGFGAVMLGMVRALADDYGALVLLDLEAEASGRLSREVLSVNLLEASFATGRSFTLGGEAVPT
ncbi:MAG: heme NO-binding domain-containing protein [Pseudomonadota bacterium]